MNRNKNLYSLVFLYPYIFISLLIFEFPFALARRAPLRPHGKLSYRAPINGVIKVAGLDVLRTYVCPPCANAVRRQIDPKGTGAITVAIPMSEVSELWQELKWILEQLSVLLDAEGLLPASISAMGSPTVAASLMESAMSVAVLPSAFTEVSSPCITNCAVPGATMPISAMESILLDHHLAGAPSTISLATATIDISSPMPSSSLAPGAISPSQDWSVFSEIPSFTAVTSEMQGSACLATFTIDETVTVSQLAVTAFGSTPTSASVEPDNMPASLTDKSMPLSIDSPNGGVFVATSVGSKPSSTGKSLYKFDSQTTKNIAVYYGQSGATGETTLEAQCADPNVDIVILAFVITRNYQGKYPDVNFGAACGGQTSKMMTEAPGLLSCPQLEGYIEICQQTYGKKVLLSIGGSTSSLSFSSASDASDFSNLLWQLFGPPGSIDIQLRPFGNVSIDGFDVDNEDSLPAHFDTFASTLRANFELDSSKSYYISSAPQCPFPDASDPLPMLLLCDFVYVQFYNNPPCEIGSSNFLKSIQQWSTALDSSSLNPKPRLYLGAPAWSAAGNSAYEHIGNAQGMQGIAKMVGDLGLSNFGGVMFWAGPEAQRNTEGGKDILGWTKAGLGQ